MSRFSSILEQNDVARVFDLFEIETNTVRRWKDDKVKL